MTNDNPFTTTPPEGSDLRSGATGMTATDEAWGSEADAADRDGEGEQDLFDPNDARVFDERWREVQTRFVDDPRGAVQQAEALVADVIGKLSDGFAVRRASLEQEQGASNSSEQTEALRLAMRRYRSFFQRLLAA